MSYKQFIQELEDDVLPSEAERRYIIMGICAESLFCLICDLMLIIEFYRFRRYQEYKSEYISTQKRAYFDAHKGEDWYFLPHIQCFSVILYFQSSLIIFFYDVG